MERDREKDWMRERSIEIEEVDRYIRNSVYECVSETNVLTRGRSRRMKEIKRGKCL